MTGKTPARSAPTMELDALYRAHVRSLYAFVYSKVGNREAAEDITSEVFTRALAHLDATREEHSMVAWLYRVARNATADYWRAGQRGRVIVLDEARTTTAVSAPNPAHQDHTAARAAALLALLPANYRTVLSCRLLEGLNVAETARRMGTSEANVKVLQHRALKRAAELREDDDSHG